MTTARHGAVQAAIYAALDQAHAEAEKRIDADLLRMKLGETPTDLLALQAQPLFPYMAEGVRALYVNRLGHLSFELTEEQCTDRLAALEAELAA